MIEVRSQRSPAMWVTAVLVATVGASLSAQPAATRTKLFMDWSNVDKGNWQPVYDTNRLTEAAHKQFAEIKKDFSIEQRTGKHGMVPYHVPSGIRITIEKATKSKPWLLPDTAWEKHIQGATVIHEQGKYRCWYPIAMKNHVRESVFDQERQMEVTGGALCYAESTNGFDWTKPSVGDYSFNGSKQNNIVSRLMIFTVFRDDHGAAEERYKAFEFAELPASEVPSNAPAMNKYGLYGVVSPDGYHWKKLPPPLVRHFCDTFNIGAWDPGLKKYVGYFRGHTLGRSITRAETDDFTNWPAPYTLMASGPQETAGDDLYSNGFTFYPGEPAIRLLFPSMYHRTTDLCDVRMAISSDGQDFNWVSQEIILEHGAAKEWDRGMVFGQPNLLRLPDGRLGLPYNGYSHTHNGSFHYYYRPEEFKSKSGLAWAIWEDGRLAGIQADSTGDFFSASSETLNGNQILINARTSRGGKVEVELVQKDKPLPGFSFAECVPFKGDGRWVPLKWKGKDLSGLSGKRFQLHFRLTKAKLFGYKIPGANTAVQPVPRDSKWIARHQGFIAESKENPPNVVFLGDSITDLWRTDGEAIWNEHFAPLNAANFGIDGDRTQHVLWRIQNGAFDGLKPKVLVLMIGTNNTPKDRNTPPEVIEGVTAVVKAVREKLPATKILLLGIFPRGQKGEPVRDQLKQINKAIARLEDGHLVKFLDIGPKLLEPDGTLSEKIMPDLLHLSEEGYRIWANTLRDTLVGMLK
jgi:lysophospholipase L1-like esterase